MSDLPERSPNLAGEELAEQLVSACRTAIGDQLRSVTYFTGDEFDQLYLRSDLERDADLGRFVDFESAGFEASDAYRGSELGDYRFTIRVFTHGFLVRVTRDKAGVFMTTDGLTMQDFEEAATAAAEVLET